MHSAGTPSMRWSMCHGSVPELPIKNALPNLIPIMDGWMNGVLGHFFALSRLNWAGDNLD